jgi:hypothetical protein
MIWLAAVLASSTHAAATALTTRTLPAPAELLFHLHSAITAERSLRVSEAQGARTCDARASPSAADSDRELPSRLRKKPFRREL